MNPGEELVKASKKIKTEKVGAPKVVPIIDTFYDVKADAGNEVATKGQPAKLFGSELKFDQADPQQGIFFVHAVTNAETRVDTVIDVKPKQVSLMIPATLKAGDYLVRIKVKRNKDVYKGELPTPVTVA